MSGEYHGRFRRPAQEHHFRPASLLCTPSHVAQHIWHRRDAWSGYAFAALLTLVALGAALALVPYDEDAPLALLLTAVALSGWRGGFGPALLAAGAGALAVDYFFDVPPYMLEVTRSETLLNLGLFIFLALIVGSANAHLRDARDRASAAVHAREELLAAVSHDLRDPLGTIRMGAQTASVLLDDAQTPDKQRHAHAQDALKHVDDATVRMDGFIQELLDFGRLRTGASLALDREQTDLVSVVQNAVEAHAFAGREIRVSLPNTPIVGNWDRLRLWRVVDNLLSNAVKYSPKQAEIHLTVALERHAGGCAELQVQDHGLGIPADQLPHVFDAFFRGSNVQGRTRGTGLGLYGAKQTVEQHGGWLSIASQEGVGTTVTVRLPLDGGAVERSKTALKVAA